MRWLLVFLLIISVFADAEMISLSFTQRFTYLEPNKKISFFTIRSQSDPTAFCLSEIFKYQDGKQEKFDKQNPKEFGVLVSPIRFVLKGFKKRKLQVFHFSSPKPDQDTIYRVRTVGVPYEKGIEDKKENKIKTMVKGSIASNILLIQPPKHPKPSAKISIKSKGLYVKNTGNTVIRFYGSQCTTEKNCKAFPYNYILSGKTKRFGLVFQNTKNTFIKYKLLSFKKGSDALEWQRFEVNAD